VVLTVDGEELSQPLRVDADPTLGTAVTTGDPEPEEKEEKPARQDD
jgi:hypothetical protein